MDKKVKERWIKALRSGEYAQGVSRLCSTNDEDKFCCLGVLCDLHARRRGAVKSDVWRAASDPTSKHLCLKYAGQITKLPVVVAQWAEVDYDIQATLALMNDDGEPFERIANWIEKYL